MFWEITLRHVVLKRMIKKEACSSSRNLNFVGFLFRNLVERNNHGQLQVHKRSTHANVRVERLAFKNIIDLIASF